MIKRILVALDPDEDTPIATRYAAEIAKRTDAEVSGLAVVDTKHIAKEIGPGGAIGGLYYAETLRKRYSEEMRTTALTLADAFVETLEQEQVRYGERIEDGVPFQRIIEDMKYHDLLVMGREPHFFYLRPEQHTKTLAHVVKRGTAPTLVVGDAYHPVEHVLIAYDGSDASARTLQRFAQLQPFGTDLYIDLVHIRKSNARHDVMESELLLHLAGTLLRAHGFTHTTDSSLYGETPGSRILAYVGQTKANLLVIGAHSVSAMRRIAFGSTTHALLTTSTIPLFLFH